MKLHLTVHAKKRAFERYEWSDLILHKKAIDALEQGIFVMHDEILKDMFVTSSIAHAIVNQHKYGQCLLYLNEGVIFVFDEDRLITVFPLNGRGTGRGR